MTAAATPADQALLDLLIRLRDAGYAFVTPTLSTAAIVTGRRPAARGSDLRDIFGWTLPFAAADLAADLLALAQAAGVLEERGEHLRATVRVASLDGTLYVHSAPGDDPNAVFLGPDSYRFVRFLRQALGEAPVFRQAVDIGAGSGVGAISLARWRPGAKVLASDPNADALRFARINARLAGVEVETLLAEGLPQARTAPDLVIANPPYIAGDAGALYKDGGGQMGAALSLDWARQAAGGLAPGGRMVLYTGAAIVEGRDAILGGLTALADAHGMTLRYDEIDPDVFGETLRQQAYAGAERIAAVGAVLSR